MARSIHAHPRNPRRHRTLAPIHDVPMKPCITCGVINHYAERHPHPDIVRRELATMIYERHQAEKTARAAFLSELRRSLMSDYWHDYQNRKNGRPVTN